MPEKPRAPIDFTEDGEPIYEKIPSKAPVDFDPETGEPIYEKEAASEATAEPYKETVPFFNQLFEVVEVTKLHGRSKPLYVEEPERETNLIPAVLPEVEPLEEDENGDGAISVEGDEPLTLSNQEVGDSPTYDPGALQKHAYGAAVERALQAIPGDEDLTPHENLPEAEVLEETGKVTTTPPKPPVPRKETTPKVDLRQLEFDLQRAGYYHLATVAPKLVAETIEKLAESITPVRGSKPHKVHLIEVNEKQTEIWICD